MLQKKHKNRGLLTTLLAVILLIGATCLIVFNRQKILDYISYFEYKPTSLIASFAERTTMNQEGKFLFYSAQPRLQDKEDFNRSCPNTTQEVAILGCYNGQNIFVYNVTDSKLDGIRDVTAAYEMLHAAYKRLSPDDRTKLDELIEAEYAKQNDPAMTQIVTLFAKTEPGQRDNELFSLLATQVPQVSPGLESYYSRYFTDRQKLVALYDKYSSVFTSLQDQATTLANRLNVLNAQIKTESAEYVAEVTSLNAQVQVFNTNAKNNNFASQTEFDNQKATLTEREDSLKAEQNDINADITNYNALLAQYNAITSSTKQLFNSINSLADSPTS